MCYRRLICKSIYNFKKFIVKEKPQNERFVAFTFSTLVMLDFMKTRLSVDAVSGKNIQVE